MCKSQSYPKSFIGLKCMKSVFDLKYIVFDIYEISTKSLNFKG